MQTGIGFLEQNRLIANVLQMYYLDNLSQVEIARKLHLSTVKINRIIKTARQDGLVEVTLKLPFPNFHELEYRISTLSNLEDVIVTPSVGDISDASLVQLSQIAAVYFSKTVRSNDVICVGGGRTVREIVNHIHQQRIPEVKIVPAIGGVQNLTEGDVNSIAKQLAEKYGGESINFYAPAFAESEEECETFFKLTHVMKVLEQVRTARIGLFGIGSLQMDSSIIKYCSLPYQVLDGYVKQREGVGEILIYAINKFGQDCIPELSKRVVGISLEDFKKIPIRIGAAIGAIKAPAIAAAIRGKFFTTLIIDELAANEVVTILESSPDENKLESEKMVVSEVT
jgi:DNA-binding transcriptional regulator LsrR (DeoR family)